MRRGPTSIRPGRLDSWLFREQRFSNDRDTREPESTYPRKTHSQAYSAETTWDRITSYTWHIEFVIVRLIIMIISFKRDA